MNYKNLLLSPDPLKKIFIGVFLSITMVCANTLVVDNTLENGKSCENTSNPYATIKSAINNANDGDTIKICKGTYNESIK